MQVVPIPPKSRSHQLGNLIDLISLVKRFAGVGQPDPHAEQKISVWHSHDAVTAILDDGDEDRRLHRATMPLRISRPFAILQNWQMNRPSLSQKEVIRALRVEFSGCADADDIAVFRSLKFTENRDGESKIEHSKETFGKKVHAEVSVVKAIPEEIILNVPVYDNPWLNQPVPIRCAVEIDTLEGVFWIIPLADSMTAAIQDRQDEIRLKLQNSLKADLSEDHDANDVFCPNVFIYEGEPTSK
ncbi:MAG: hypothetical protein ABFE01_04605 [Phycisphaerales bacterium]